MKITDFEPGDVVVICAPSFPRYYGLEGIVQKSNDEIYIHVFVKGFGIGGWSPDQLRLADVTSEKIEAELGEGYLD